MNKAILNRFWSKVEKTNTCWLWTAYHDKDGYGRFKINAKVTKLAHRISYELFNNPIPKGLQIDHLCRIRNCVNPEHLEVVTQKENILRGRGLTARYSNRNQCLQGHEFSKENTLIRTDGGRRCRVCKRSREFQRYWNKKGE